MYQFAGNDLLVHHREPLTTQIRERNIVVNACTHAQRPKDSTVTHGQCGAPAKVVRQCEQALRGALTGDLGGFEVRRSTVIGEVSRVASLYFVAREALPFTCMALAQTLVECYRGEPQLVGDDACSHRRPLKVARHDRTEQVLTDSEVVAKTQSRHERLSLADWGEGWIRLTLPAPLCVPRGLSVADHQNVRRRRRAG